jgi:hypothetical protein
MFINRIVIRKLSRKWKCWQNFRKAFSYDLLTSIKTPRLLKKMPEYIKKGYGRMPVILKMRRYNE